MESALKRDYEILQAMTVAVVDPPSKVAEFHEGDFERAGYQAHEAFGPVTPDNLTRMLQFHGFKGV